MAAILARGGELIKYELNSPGSDQQLLPIWEYKTV